MVYGSVPSLIQPIWPWQRPSASRLVVTAEEHIFFANGPFLFAIQPNNLAQYGLATFCPSPSIPSFDFKKKLPLSGDGSNFASSEHFPRVPSTVWTFPPPLGIAVKKRQTLLWTYGRGWNPERAIAAFIPLDSFLVANILDRIWQSDLLSRLSRAYSIKGLPIRDGGLCHFAVVMFGSPGCGSWKADAWPCWNSLKPNSHDRHQRTVTVCNIQTPFDFSPRFRFQVKQWNHWPILLFSVSLKSGDTPVSTRRQNKITIVIRLKFYSSRRRKC